MPEFQLNNNAKPAKLRARYRDLNEFERGYIEAMFFTNGDTGSDDETLLNRLGTEKLTREAIAAIVKDCDAFAGHVMPDGCFVRQWLDRFADYSDAQAGRDFWFTRQGHGVGFWERSELNLKGDDAAEYERLTALMVATHESDRAAWQAALNERDALEAKSAGKCLSDAAKVAGEASVEVSRGWIYHR